jgi:uncharacterized protein YwqG
MIDKRALDAVHFVAKQSDTPEDVVRMVVRKMLPSIRLAPQPAAEEELPLGTSRIGGCPDLPGGTKWPRRRVEGPYRFILQVNLAEVAPFDVAKVLPTTGLLSFFYARNPDEWPGDYAFIVQAEAKDLRRLRWPRDLPENRRYRPLALRPCVEWTVASIQDTGFDGDEVLDSEFPHFDFFDEIETQVAQAQGMEPATSSHVSVHRLLGHPRLIHSPGLADGTRLLLQVDSDPPSFRGPDLPRIGLMIGDCGRFFYLTSEGELKSRRFDKKPWVLVEV